MLQLMPSPRWKLVVDVGETDPDITVVESAAGLGMAEPLARDEEDFKPSKNSRIDQVISLLGEYMPSDPASPLVPGFMSLRLMLLRPSKSAEDEDMVRTILGSYSSYIMGGRSKQDIAVNLSRDFMFLSQQSQAQPLFPSFGQSMMSSAPMSNSTGFSLFSLLPSGTSSASASFQNSPALAPIVPNAFLSNGQDSLSIVSN
jgi:hypothetical protein